MPYTACGFQRVLPLSFTNSANETYTFNLNVEDVKVNHKVVSNKGLQLKTASFVTAVNPIRVEWVVDLAYVNVVEFEKIKDYATETLLTNYLVDNQTGLSFNLGGEKCNHGWIQSIKTDGITTLFPNPSGIFSDPDEEFLERVTLTILSDVHRLY